jgi:hypothetical protein
LPCRFEIDDKRVQWKTRCMRVGLALAIHVSAAMVMSVAAAEPSAPAHVDRDLTHSAAVDAASAPPRFAPGLPLRRESDSDAVGPRNATLAAAGILLIAVWVTVQYRRRQRGVPGRLRAPAWPWLGHLLPDAQARHLRVVETASLTPHARLHVVEWKGREYLVSTAPDHVRVLDRREVPAEQAQDQASESS